MTQNLTVFIQLAAGLDDVTWRFHLQRGDYSRWLREAIKDPDLAAEVADIEPREALPSSESRARVTRAIEARYTAPA